MFIFHKTEIQTVILRCLTIINLNCYKSYDTKHKNAKNANVWFCTKSQKNGNGNICILCHNFWTNQNLDPLCPSKWPSGPQFCERLSCNWQINDQKWSKNGHLWVIDFQDFFFQNGNRTVCVFCCSFWSNQDLDMFSTSKWLSALNFFERLLCSWRKNDQKWS